jgi:hypothetical protein
MKIVINRCYGGFCISREAAEFMAARGSERAQLEIEEADKSGNWYGYGYSSGLNGYERNDPWLVEAVETLGKEADGRLAQLNVVEIPNDIKWEIEDDGGMEVVIEPRREWY